MGWRQLSEIKGVCHSLFCVDCQDHACNCGALTSHETVSETAKKKCTKHAASGIGGVGRALLERKEMSITKTLLPERPDLPSLLQSIIGLQPTFIFLKKKKRKKDFSKRTPEFTAVFLLLCDSGFRSKIGHLLNTVDIYYCTPLNAIILLQNVLKFSLCHFPFP